MVVIGIGTQMAAGEQGEVAAAALAQVGQEVLDLELEGPARLGHPDVAQSLAAVGVDEALVFGIRRAHDGFRHAELDIGSHQIDHGSEGGRRVDQIDEFLAVRQDVAAIHALASLGIGVAPDLLSVEPVDLADQPGYRRLREHPFEKQIAIDSPLALLRVAQCVISGMRKPPGLQGWSRPKVASCVASLHASVKAARIVA